MESYPESPNFNVRRHHSHEAKNRRNHSRLNIEDIISIIQIGTKPQQLISISLNHTVFFLNTLQFEGHLLRLHQFPHLSISNQHLPHTGEQFTSSDYTISLNAFCFLIPRYLQKVDFSSLRHRRCTTLGGSFPPLCIQREYLHQNIHILSPRRIM